MKEVLFDRIKDVFELKSLTLDKEPKSHGGYSFSKKLFISCDFETPYQLRKFFHRPHSTVWNYVTRINLTDEAFEKACLNVWIKSLHGDTASIEIKYDGDDKCRILFCGPYSGYAVLWSGRLQDLVRYFNDHHEVTATHSTCEVSFTGRRAGSIGEFYKIKLRMSVPTYYYFKNDEGTREFLHEKGYEHISDLKTMWISQNADINYFKEVN